jgi:hypothetical protein
MQNGTEIKVGADDLIRKYTSPKLYGVFVLRSVRLVCLSSGEKGKVVVVVVV